MVVRDLLISFGAKLDPNSMRDVENKAKGMAGVVQKLFSAAFVFGVGKGLLAINELASDVEENMNVITQSFGENAGEVTAWAKTFGDAANRNRYEMEAMAGTMGALLNPLMEKNTELATDMSIGVAQLAVDLGSFYNVADGNALHALRSGLSGEAEPLKKFGIIMNTDTLEAYRLTKGIKGTVKSMSVAEKTALRYNFILEQTSTAQGDAIRTADGWANAKKGLIGKLQEMATTAGMKVLPIMSRMLNSAKSMVMWFNEITRGTHFFESALLTLSVVAAAVAIKLLIAFGPVLLPMLKLAAIFALVVLIVEDFYTFLKGGDSLIGRFIDSIWGPGSAAAALDYLKLAFEALVFFWDNAMLPGLKNLWEGFKLFAGFLSEVTVKLVKEMIVGFKQIWDFLTGFFGWIGEELDATVELISKFLGLFDSAKGKMDALKKGGDAKFTGSITNRATKTAANADARFNAVMGNSSASTRGPITIHNTSQVSVGSATPETANKIANAAVDDMAKLNRRTQAALVQKAGS